MVQDSPSAARKHHSALALASARSLLMSSLKDKKDAGGGGTPVFPVGPAGKRELRKALIRSTDPAKTIASFQQKHSLHSMMARAFGTTPSHEYRATRNATEKKTVESLDTDSVMTFLSHLGVRQHEVHLRLSDTLLKLLQDEIRKSKSKESLLELLKSCWVYATTIPELRPVLWAVLKQLGEETPLPVLLALAERDADGNLKHPEVFQPLPPLLKRLCWEADFDCRIVSPDETSGATGAAASTTDPHQYLDRLRSTLLFEAAEPLMEQYRSNPVLVDAANDPFAATVRERRLPTKQRRALTASSSSAGSTTAATARAPPPSSSSLLRGAVQPLTAAAGAPKPAPPSEDGLASSGRAVAHLRSLLSDSVGAASTFRPKLVYALLSTLMAQHGALVQEASDVFGGARHLHCSLVADLLLSAGGPLPKAYQHVLTLAQVLDESVQDGNVNDVHLARIQAALRDIFQPDESAMEKGAMAGSPSRKPGGGPPADGAKPTEAPSNSLIRQLNRIITAGLTAMKEADPQSLFLNPVTDAIAPGYSKVITKPMCISTMERKVDKNEYNSVADWEQDVKLMFKNCIDYNRGSQGQWFRGEALRQGKVFREEIFPVARRSYQTEVAKRTVAPASEEGAAASLLKRKAEDGPAIAPLPASNKKRKKEAKEDYLPSMPAIACMLLADPFVVRIMLARVLRELRRGVLNGTSLPVAHAAVPSLLQLLHMAQWSRQICAVRGRRYCIPDSGIEITPSTNDPSAYVPFATLRRVSPLLLRLLLEADFYRRTAPGGDLQAAPQSMALEVVPISAELWQDSAPLEVALSLVQGALIIECQPGMGNESALSKSFPMFALALQLQSTHLCEQRSFFQGLVHVLSKHKAKLPIETRDAIVASWLQWLRSVQTEDGSMATPAHELLIRLLNEWASLGNKVMPRDKLVQLTLSVVEAVDSTTPSSEGKFAALWKSDSSRFREVKKQYERMLRLLPTAQANLWRQEVRLDDAPETNGSSRQIECYITD